MREISSRAALPPPGSAIQERLDGQSRLAVPGRYQIICHRSAPKRYPEEAFDELRICIPLENALYSVRRATEGGRRKIGYLGSRDVLVVPVGQPHAIDWQRHADWVSLTLADSFLRESLKLHPHNINDAFTLRDPFASSVAAELRNAMFAPQPASVVYVEALAIVIALRIAALSQLRLSLHGGARPFASARLANIEGFIDKNLDQSISVSMLAARESLSLWHFSRRFSASYGVTPREFIANRRLKRAQDLLLHSTLSITEVAFEIGLAPSHFSRSFQKRFGISPRRFREQNTG